MSVARVSKTLATGSLLALMVCHASPSAFADEPRVTLSFLPGSPPGAKLFTVEISNAGSPRSVAIPSLTIAGGRSGLQIGGYTTVLPVLKLGGVSLAQRYGDQRLSLDFQPSTLAGMGLDARAVRGLSLSAARQGASGTVLIGRLAGSPVGFLESALPRVLAFTGTVTRSQRLAISPRFVVPLGHRETAGGADPTLGAGLRANVSPHVSLIGDIGRTRARSGRWAHLVTAGVLGRWTRVTLQASASRADGAFTLLGSVPFAAQDRKLAGASVLLLRGVTFEGQLGAFRPVEQSPGSAGTVTSSTTLRIERFERGNFLLVVDRSASRAQRADNLMVEWRQKGGVGATIQLRERWDRAAPAMPASGLRRLQVELLRVPTGSHRLTLSFRSSLLLSHPQSRESRMDSHVSGRLAVGARIGLTGEADLAMPRAPTSARLHDLRTGGEIVLSRGAAMQIVCPHASGDPRPAWKRLEIRYTRSLSF